MYERANAVAQMVPMPTLAKVTAGLLLIIGLILVVERGGLIAWSALLGGLVMLAKGWFKPTNNDLVVSLGLALLLGLAWFGTWRYVISTWESGEVVELVIATDAGEHTARLWILDIGAEPLVYYDAPPLAANSLLAGTPVQFTRGGEVSTRTPVARLVDGLAEAEANQVLEAMGTTYGDRNNAATWYYLMLGRSRDRVALVITLVEPQAQSAARPGSRY